MSKENLWEYEDMAAGWTSRDKTRIEKKLYNLFKEVGEEEIIFNSIDELAMMLDEKVDYKLEHSLIRLCREGKIFFHRCHNKNDENILDYYISIRRF